jgi:hypothetical protein
MDPTAESHELNTTRKKKLELTSYKMSYLNAYRYFELTDQSINSTAKAIPYHNTPISGGYHFTLLELAFLFPMQIL